MSDNFTLVVDECLRRAKSAARDELELLTKRFDQIKEVGGNVTKI